MPGLVEVKRTYKRRKPRRDDLRCNTALTTILPIDYEEGRRAFVQSYQRGLGLDIMVTIRPRSFETMVLEERWDETKRWLKSLRMFFADNENLPEFAYLLSRESTPVREGRKITAKGEHIHLLLHVGDQRRAVEKYLRRQFPARREAEIEDVRQETIRLRCGWLGDASTYLLKAVSSTYWKAYPATPHRPSGPVFGPRVLWSTNINETRPRHRISRKSKLARLPRAA